MKPANQNTHKARMSKTGHRMPACKGITLATYYFL